MFEFYVSIQEKGDHLKLINEALKELESFEVLVGVTEEESPRLNQQDGMNNAELLYIHTNGSPINGLPARPVIEPALENDKEIISELISKSFEKAMDGDINGMRNALDNVGKRGEAVARGWFTNPKNEWAELKGEAIAIRQKKMKKRDFERMEQEIKDNPNFVPHRPLINTGKLRKSIKYIVRKK